MQKNLAFLVNFEEKGYADEINLKGLLKRIKMGSRIGEGIPPFHEFSDIAVDRNTKMRERTVNDTAFANTIIKVWGFYGQTSPPLDKESTMSFFLEDVKKFKAKGGNLILLRCPSTGGMRIGESVVSPRLQFWDELISQANVKGYHFEDYEQFKGFTCPEESHLSATDSRIFTTELVKIMIEDNALVSLNNN